MKAETTQIVHADGSISERHVLEAGDPGFNEQEVRTKAEQAIARMTQIADSGPFTAAQRDTAIRDNSRAVRALLRLNLSRFESAD